MCSSSIRDSVARSRGNENSRFGSEFSCSSILGTETAKATRDHAEATEARLIQMATASNSVCTIRRSLTLALALLFSSAACASDVNVQQAIDRVQQETNGKVLSVQTLQIGKRRIYRIKILTSTGQVRVVEVRADQ